MDPTGLLATVTEWLGLARSALPELPALGAVPLPAGMETSHLLAVAAALGWASGLRLYAVVFFTGLAGWLGWVNLPAGLQLLQNPLLMGASGLMLMVEFLADKIPGLDSVWDALHAFVRIPAGAALAAGVFGGDQAQWATVAALMGGTLAATSQIAKTTTRAAINTSPEPFSNIAMSLAGDAAVPVMLWLSWQHPVVFAVCLTLAVVLMVVLTVVLMKFLKSLIRSLRQRFGAAAATP